MNRVPLIIVMRDTSTSGFSFKVHASWTVTQGSLDFLQWRGAAIVRQIAADVAHLRDPDRARSTSLATGQVADVLQIGAEGPAIHILVGIVIIVHANRVEGMRLKDGVLPLVQLGVVPGHKRRWTEHESGAAGQRAADDARMCIGPRDRGVAGPQQLQISLQRAAPLLRVRLILDFVGHVPAHVSVRQRGHKAGPLRRVLRELRTLVPMCRIKGKLRAPAGQGPERHEYMQVVRPGLADDSVELIPGIDVGLRFDLLPQ